MTSTPADDFDAADAAASIEATDNVEATDSAEPEPEKFFDYTDLLVAARSQRKSVRRLPRLISESMRFAWAADRRIFFMTTALQLIGGAIVFLQLRLTKRLLDQMTAVAAHHISVASAMKWVAALVIVTSFSTVSAAVLAQQQRLLAELVTRSTWQQILDVAAAVNLRAFESSNFFDRFSRVQANALSRPYAMTQGLFGVVGGFAGVGGVAAAIISIQPLL
ncbi:MAG: ATP-binding cassette, subfamily bacterial, partial [Actinomycetota bacterium]|nr:ATP-binding cassette, subfamily bacterial [Actinomycetota bacterium]